MKTTMKTTMKIIGLVLLSFPIIKVNAQWSKITPNMPVNEIQSAYFTSSSIGWFIGFDGSIYHTTNGGQTAVQQASGTTNHLNDIFFISQNEGWIVGYNGTILHTTNGGNNWTASNYSNQTRLNSVYFTSASNGWIVGDNGLILRTTNGGNTWLPQTSGTGLQLNSITFSSPTDGWIAPYEANSGILKTNDGGNTWTLTAITQMQFKIEVGFLNSNIGWITGDDILLTTDGGINWAKKNVPLENVTDCYFTSNTDGWVCGIDYGQGGLIYHTNDGGNTWVKYNSYYGYFNKMFFISNSEAWILGQSILKTTTSGTSWLEPNVSALGRNYSSIFSLVSKSNLELYSLVEESLAIWPEHKYSFLKSTDGGVTWQKNSLFLSTWKTDPLWNTLIPEYYELKRHGSNLYLTFRDSLWCSLNDGTTWVKKWFQIAGFEATDIFIKPSGNIVVVGITTNSNDVILESTDNGTTWTQNSLSFKPDGIFFINNQIGWAYSYSFQSGTAIWHTSDGGINWTNLSTIPEGPMKDIYFSTPTNGYIFNSEGIFHTSDGGNSWTKTFDSEIFATSTNINSIEFQSANQGWAVGNTYSNVSSPSTFILYTNDGGNSWNFYNINDNYNCEFDLVHFNSIDNGWILGNRNNPVLLHVNNASSIVSTQSKWQPNLIESEVYPNPMNEVSTIKYEVQGTLPVQLSLFDVTGKEIEALVNETKTSGKYNVEINRNNLTNGIYFYRLQIGDNIETKKIIIQ